MPEAAHAAKASWKYEITGCCRSNTCKSKEKKVFGSSVRPSR
jgi:hypothetical protein